MYFHTAEITVKTVATILKPEEKSIIEVATRY